LAGFKIWSAVPIEFLLQLECAQPFAGLIAICVHWHENRDNGNRLQSAKARVYPVEESEVLDLLAATMSGDFPIRESLEPEVPIPVKVL
jgi:hypothetical protein